jgi:ABC-type branched-chain amino acid transport system, permease component
MTSLFLTILIYTAIYSLMAIGQNLITGYGGMLSLCQAGFYAIGAYTTAILTTKCGFSFWATLPVAMLITAAFGFIIGMPTLRLRGDYLAIATLGFGEIVRNVLTNWVGLTNGPMGIRKIPKISVFGYQVGQANKPVFLLLVWFFVLLAYLLMRRLARSRMGRALAAIREDEIAAHSMGINPTKYKVAAFMLGGAVAGLAGSFYVAYMGSVMPSSFTFMISIMVLCMVVLGGMGNFAATILGAFIIEFIDYMPRLFGITNLIPAQFKQVIFGLILVVMMIWRPQGLLGREKFAYFGKRKVRGGNADVAGN